MRAKLYRRQLGLMLACTSLLIPFGCCNTPLDVTQGPADLRMPSPGKNAESCDYEEGLEGHHIFEMNCAACHNARPLAERPFANYQNVAQHMRVRANLTGAEYAKLTAWLRRWHDVPPPTPPLEPSPKRFFFSQPIPEMRPQTPAAEPAALPKPAPEAAPIPKQPKE